MTDNKLLYEVQKASFAVKELNLYLDTHPGCTDGLAKFDAAKKKLAEAVAAYEASCGPLTPTGVNTSAGWTWTNDPWPWETNC